MQQMPVNEDAIVYIDYTRQDLSAAFREFRPTVYRNGSATYCCILGPDFRAGIFGCGVTVEKAIADWNNHFAERMKKADLADEVWQYIRDFRSISKNDVWY